MVPWRAFAWAWWTIEVSTRWLSPSATSRTCGSAVTASVRGILRRGSSSVTIDSSRHCGGPVAEVDGNRTRQTEMLGLDGFEDRGDHQDPDTSTATLAPSAVGDTKGGGSREYRIATGGRAGSGSGGVRAHVAGSAGSGSGGVQAPRTGSAGPRTGGVQALCTGSACSRPRGSSGSGARKEGEAAGWQRTCGGIIRAATPSPASP